ncbi:MAG: carboxypeptidase regulatory-like domain-containing protein [Terriglobales bacterium]
MKNVVLAIALAVSVPAFVLVSVAPAAAQQQTRSLQGQVTDDNAGVGNAIVYLKNTKTLAVKTYIADDKGMYHFNALSPNIDYEIYAEKDGRKSDTKTLSSFDSRKQATINLKLK